MLLRCIAILTITTALQAIAWTQTAPAGARTRPLTIQSLPEPPVPGDPLELVSGNAEAVQNPEQRQAAFNLLTNARAASNVRAHAYHLVTTFTSVGSSSSDGAWTLDDMSPSGKIYRWAAQGAGYSAVNLYNNQLLYTNQSSEAIPLRLAQVREAIFFAYPAMGPYLSLRTANGYLDGIQLSCVLTAPGFQGKSFSGGRSWEESEYCVNAASGFLMTYSPAPGLYIRYDYTNAIPFHGKTIPGGFIITEAGRTIIQAKTQSVSDPADADPALFQPAGLTALGVGSMMTFPVHARARVGEAGDGGGGVLNVVALHGVSSPDGHVSEVEILASTNPSLSQAALNWATNWQMISHPQNGSTPQSHEILFTFESVTP